VSEDDRESELLSLLAEAGPRKAEYISVAVFNSWHVVIDIIKHTAK